MSSKVFVVVASLICLHFVSMPDARADQAHEFSIQGGWWNFEAEYLADFGLFVDAGVPWFAMVMDGDQTGSDWSMAVEGKVGYQFSVSDSWRLRAGFRTAFSFWHGCPCSSGAEETHTKSFAFLEVGVRYEHSSGIFVGVDLPLYAFDDFHELLSGNSSGVEHFPPGVSFLFSQLYCGYGWKF